MISEIYSYSRVLSLLLSFQSRFRKPSGTFRNAGFKCLTYGCYLRDHFSEQIEPLTAPTYSPPSGTQTGPWVRNAM